MLNNLPKISTTQAIQRIVETATVRGLGAEGSHAGLTVILYGEAGCGKTFAAKAAAKALGYKYREVQGLHHTPTDITGQRTIDIQGGDYIKHHLADWTKGLGPDDKVIINLDELSKAPGVVERALLGVVNERKAGQFEFGQNWVFVITGNLASARGGDKDLSGPMRTRGAQFIVENTESGYLTDYAIPNNLHPYVTTFIERNGVGSADFPEGCLNTWDPEENPAAWSNERAWHNMSQVCEAGLNVRDWAYSILGNVVGEHFALHCRAVENVADWDDIKNSPDTAMVPDDMLLAHYTGKSIAFLAQPADMDSVATYLRRMPAECATNAMSELVKRHPECKETRAYIAFRSEYKLSL